MFEETVAEVFFAEEDGEDSMFTMFAFPKLSLFLCFFSFFSFSFSLLKVKSKSFTFVLQVNAGTFHICPFLVVLCHFGNKLKHWEVFKNLHCGNLKKN